MPRTKEPLSLIATMRPETFDVRDDNWMRHLMTEGYVVLNEAITENEANEAIKLFKEDYTRISPKWDWNDSNTWIPSNAPMMWGKGASTYNGIGQSDTMWYLRMNSVARTAFSQIYGTDDLITSFDGCSLFVSDKQKSESWLHQDQHRDNPLLSIQGVLNLLECSEYDAGFVCVPGSHISYIGQEAKKDWVLVPKDDEIGKDAVKLLTPARSMILFNSRLIHANSGMSKNHPNKVHINRISAYITFAPKTRRNEETLEKRKRGYIQGETTSHWPNKFEPKRVPFSVSKHYKERNLKHLTPLLTKNNDIPIDRLMYI